MNTHSGYFQTTTCPRVTIGQRKNVDDSLTSWKSKYLIEIKEKVSIVQQDSLDNIIPAN